jgi:hypothetical protein
MLLLAQVHALIVVVIQAAKLVVKQQPLANVLFVRILTISLQTSAHLVRTPIVTLALDQELANVLPVLPIITWNQVSVLHAIPENSQLLAQVVAHLVLILDVMFALLPEPQNAQLALPIIIPSLLNVLDVLKVITQLLAQMRSVTVPLVVTPDAQLVL